MQRPNIVLKEIKDRLFVTFGSIYKNYKIKSAHFVHSSLLRLSYLILRILIK